MARRQRGRSGAVAAGRGSVKPVAAARIGAAACDAELRGDVPVLMTPAAEHHAKAPSVSRYRAPVSITETGLRELLLLAGRDVPAPRQFDLLRSGDSSAERGNSPVFYAGELSLLESPCVSVVGTRDVSEEGRLRAWRLARELAEAGVVVVSGLAKGVDTAALTGAIKHGGRVVAVIGTALGNAYPAENARLQETIWEEHLLVSPFRDGEPVYRSNFPKRNRVMAALSDATVIVEASDTSGTLHQAAECQRLGRWLFIMRSIVDNPALVWPKSFLGKPRTAVLESSADIIQAISE
jgi:DNA processing protein